MSTPVHCLLLAAAVSLAACAATEPAAPLQIAPLAADWREHSRPLINEGEGLQIGTTSWRVPATLPAGRYVLVRDTPAGPVLVEGRRIDVDRDPSKEVHVMLPFGYSGVIAVEEGRLQAR